MAKTAKVGKKASLSRTLKKSGQVDTTQPQDAGLAGAGHIDQIRDIIFGSQMAAYETQFKQMEERINAHVQDLAQKMEEQKEFLEKHIRDQRDDFDKRLKDEHTRWDQESKARAANEAKTEASLTQAIDGLSAQQTQDVSALEKQLKALSAELSDEIHIQQVEASKNLERAVQELGDAKLNHKALSKLLMEMAGQLANEQG